MATTASIHWYQPIDNYCERTDALFWSEPLNALSNAGFVVAALWLAVKLHRQARQGLLVPQAIWVLLALQGFIGVGSFLFHTFATRWAELADVLPIYLFMHIFAAVFLRWAVGWSWRWAWLGAPAFFIFAQLLAYVVPTDLLGVRGYAPALLCLLLFSLWLYWRRDVRAKGFAWAAACFLVALLFRQLDSVVCPLWPWGTHFLWHLLNAITLSLVTYSLLSDRLPRPLP